ncbi:MAG: DUF4296 domain-containing protein [Flavobacteriaceae bacterium]|nr:DUF4296 domain-containing protein [Flavobacteriaceae bacterium]
MKYIIFITLFVLFLSCESKTKFKEPESLISKEQMIDLLTDLHIATSSRNIKDKNLEKNKNYMGLVFEKYKIDSTQFANNNTYYMSNIVEYENMFKEVEKRLKTLRDKYNIEKDTLEENIRREEKGRGFVVE